MDPSEISRITSSSKPKYAKLSDLLAYIIKVSEIAPESYYILGSYAIRKERENEGRSITDLDVAMRPDQFNKLRSLGFGLINDEYTGGSGVKTPQYAITINGEYEIEIFSIPDDMGIPINEFSRTTIGNTGFQKDENGHLVFTPKTLLNWKRRMGRAKNAPNIKILEKICLDESEPYLCGTTTASRGLCVAKVEDCDTRTEGIRTIPGYPKGSVPVNSPQNIEFGYPSARIGAGCYRPYTTLIKDYEQTNAVHQQVPSTFKLLTYNIWGLAKSKKKQELFSIRQPILEKTLHDSGADMICFQEMSHYSFEALKGYLSLWTYKSEFPFPQIKGHTGPVSETNAALEAKKRKRTVDVYFVSKYTPKKVTNYSLPGVLDYYNNILVVEYTNLVIINLYSQAGSKNSPGQEKKWIHYARCRSDLLYIIYEMVKGAYKDNNVIICGDFNCHLDGSIEEWPELEEIRKLGNIGFIDTYRHLYPNVRTHPGYTEDSNTNILRWNAKFREHAEKHDRYDTILYKGPTWKPTKSEVIGQQTVALDEAKTKRYLELTGLTPAEIATAISTQGTLGTNASGRALQIKGIQANGHIHINASDHFGVITSFERKVTGGYTRKAKRAKKSKHTKKSKKMYGK